MKKILVRCGMRPQDNYNIYELLDRDRFGSNNGNLVYQYSVIRTIMTDEVEIISDEYANSPNNAKKINENYDAYIIPLADAFRDNFMPTLRNYTKLIEKLNIPVVVIGVGLKAPLNYDVTNGFTFDDDVRAFVTAVLKKSSMIGLRGKITGDYLEYLGFEPEKDFTVIGCPSMYLYGRNLILRDVKLDNNSIVSLNASNIASEKSMNLLMSVANRYNNYYFVPQSYNELIINYFGFGEVKNVVPDFPQNIGSKFYKEGRVKYFLNAPTWFEFMRKTTLSIGGRLHGNIVATINGTPSVTIYQDARMKELAEYHGLPAISVEKLNEYKSLDDLLADIDFNLVQHMQPSKFDHYIDFLDSNQLDHIYKQNRNRVDAPLDKLVQAQKYDNEIDTITTVDESERILRLTKGFDIYQKRTERLINNKFKGIKKKNQQLVEEVQKLKMENQELLEQIDLSSLKLSEKNSKDSKLKKIIKKYLVK